MLQKVQHLTFILIQERGFLNNVHKAYRKIVDIFYFKYAKRWHI